jgi:sugar O-acyltransferase (sialic acid O-acetyltransferase NeuD family)
MLIIGAKGFAKEVLEVLYLSNAIDNLAFYDDINLNAPNTLFDKFPILKTLDAAKAYFETTDNRFTIGIGNPVLRRKLHDKFIALGGVLTTTKSPNASIGSFGVTIGKGCNILNQSVLSSDVTIGLCAIIYYNAVLTHDVRIGDYVEISPGAILLGRSVIGDYSQIGSHATILPDVILGQNVIVAAGAVVTKNVPDNCMVAGVPAVIKKRLEPLSFLNEQ